MDKSEKLNILNKEREKIYKLESKIGALIRLHDRKISQENLFSIPYVKKQENRIKIEKLYKNWENQQVAFKDIRNKLIYR